MALSITTKFLGPTNFRGSRVKASDGRTSITLSWDHALDAEANHDAAAVALLKKLGRWEPGRRTYYRGGLDGTPCYVYTEAADFLELKG